MFKANCCIIGPSWSFHFAERRSHCLRYITQAMIEKLYRVLVDDGDMTSLLRALATQQHVECKIHSRIKGKTKSDADAAIINKVSIGLHPHVQGKELCPAEYYL